MRTIKLLALCGLLAGGCVTQGTYDAKLAEMSKLRQADAKSAADREARLKAELEKKLADLDQELTDTQAQLKAKEDELAKLTIERDQLRKQLDDSTALSSELKKRLEKLGQNVNKLTSEKGQLAAGIEDMKKSLEELRKQKAAAEQRAAVFRGLVAKLRSMIDSGQLKVVIRDGRMLIQLPNDVLFDSGKTELKPDGQKALAKVAQVLAGIRDRRFSVVGHTDNVRIHTSRFPSNWELSTARAVEVVKLLVASGMRPEVLSASGQGEFDPVAQNDTPAHKAQNRRIEIVLQPNLSDLPSLDNLVASPSR